MVSHDYIINAGKSQNNCVPVNAALTKEEAIEKAKSFGHLDDVKKVTPDDLELVDGAYVNIVVETIKNDDPTNTNIDTVFLKALI